MQTTPNEQKESGLMDLMRDFPEEIKTLIRQEMALAKTEINEKMGRLKVSFGVIAAGGFTAAVAAVVLMAGIGFLIGAAFQSLGLSEPVANGLGFVLVGVIFAQVGYMAARRAMKHVSDEGLTPKKTLEALKTTPASLKPGGDGHRAADMRVPEELRSETDEVKSRVDRSQQRVHETVHEIQTRLRPKYVFGVAMPRQMRRHPARMALVGLGTAFAACLYLRSTAMRVTSAFRKVRR